MHEYDKKVEELQAWKTMAGKLAEMLDGYQESCGEEHSRPDFDCLTCGKEERVLADYRALVDA